MAEYIDKEAFCLMLYNRGMRLLDEDKEPVLAATLHAVEKMAHDFPAADVRENVTIRTRGDAIRAMSDEELARFLFNYMGMTEDMPDDMSKETALRLWLDWLKAEVEK